MKNTTSFDDLPEIVVEISKKLDLLLSDRITQVKDEDNLMTMEDLRDYLPENPARQTVYAWVNDRKVPYEKYGRRLYFRKSEIDKWIANGRRK